jgi:hypothetical protein
MVTKPCQIRFLWPNTSTDVVVVDAVFVDVVVVDVIIVSRFKFSLQPLLRRLACSGKKKSRVNLFQFCHEMKGNPISDFPLTYFHLYHKKKRVKLCYYENLIIYLISVSFYFFTTTTPVIRQGTTLLHSVLVENIIFVLKKHGNFSNKKVFFRYFSDCKISI